LLSKQDLEATSTIKLLFTTVTAIQQFPSANAEQLAMGEKAARQLLAYDKMPDGVTADAWAQANAQLHCRGERSAPIYRTISGHTGDAKQRLCSGGDCFHTSAPRESG